MTEIIVNAAICFLDAFILSIYLKYYLGKRNLHSPSFIFYLSVIGIELLLTANDYFFVIVNSHISMIITSVISIITTSLLCLFYTHKPGQILFCSILFQVMILLSEQICTLIISHTSADISSLDQHQYRLTMNLLSDMILLIMVMLFSLVFMKNFRSYPFEFNILLLVTPVLSILILIFAPRDSKTTVLHFQFYELLCLSVGILNVTNEWLLERTAQSYSDHLKLIRLTQQIQYQQEKYLQLSESYKNARRIIHDIKKHYSVMQEYIQAGQYKNLLEYLHISAKKLEQTYTKYNTGNLVIDSLLTNYDSLAAAEHIIFRAELHVDCSKIPVSDYDLCIILGNLLDNSLKACETGLVRDMQTIDILAETADSNQFLIRIQNTWNPDNPESDRDDLYHGYGLENVEKIVDDSNGIMQINRSDLFIVRIMIPVTPPY